MKAWGLTLCTKNPKWKSDTVTAVVVPSWIDSGDVVKMSVLLDLGASPDARCKRETTPLHIALLAGRDAAVAVLVDAKADTSLENPRDGSPLCLAATLENVKATRLLLKGKAYINARSGHRQARAGYGAAQ